MRHVTLERLARKASLCLATFAAAAVSSAPADESGFYFGANAGPTAARIDDERITSSLLAGGFTTTAIDDDERDTGYKVFGGYRFTRNFALEFGYFDLGEFGFVASTTPAGTASGTIRVDAVDLAVVGVLPFTDRLSASGRIGGSYAEARDVFVATGLVTALDPNRNRRALNFEFGIGLEYAFTESFALRVEAESHRIADAVDNIGDIALVSLGVVLRLGAETRPAVASATPTSVVPAARDPVLVGDLATAPAHNSRLSRHLHFGGQAKLGGTDSPFMEYPDAMPAVGRQIENEKIAELHLKLSQHLGRRCDQLSGSSLPMRLREGCGT